jgi:ribonuclease D
MGYAPSRMSSLRPITTLPELEALCGRLSSAPFLAVDTEFIRDRTYFAQLCLVQVASEAEHALIDPIALPDLGALRDLLAKPSIVKVFHAGRQDLEIFLDAWGVLPAPIFDTQLAATVLGFPSQTSYARLVSDVLGTPVDKAGTLTDWARRPLTDDQLRYAADDVIHLVQLYIRMRAMLAEQGRQSWLDAELSAMADPAGYRTLPEDCWRLVKGAGHARGAQRATLRQIAAWRERMARERNMPRRWVLPDESVVELSKKRPRTLDDLRAVRGVAPQMVEKVGNDLLAAIALADEQGSADPEPHRDVLRMDAETEVVADLLSCLVRLRAQERGIAPTQLAPRAVIDRVALEGEDADVPVLQDWRREVVGDDMLALRDGRIQLVVRDGAVHVEPGVGSPDSPGTG